MVQVPNISTNMLSSQTRSNTTSAVALEFHAFKLNNSVRVPTAMSHVVASRLSSPASVVLGEEVPSGDAETLGHFAMMDK